MKQINKQAGFTLIELIMVIVILGVLSAFALPRFADLGKEARVASIQGAAGALKAASAIAHSKWLVGGTGTLTATTVDLEGTSVDMINGYPTLAGILVAAQISGDDFDTTTTAGTVMVKGAPTPATCSVAYTQATSSGTPAVVTAVPTFTVKIAGC